MNAISSTLTPGTTASLNVGQPSENATLSDLNVLVLGGTGFIGRHAVAALHAAGAQIAVGSRHPLRHEQAYPFAKLVEIRFERLLNPSNWADVLTGVDVVINCVGILRQRPGESYDEVHHLAPQALALACAAMNVRLIHTSALALHDGAKSRFLSSKLLGERAIQASRSDYAIVRPSLLDGKGGFGSQWLRGLSRSPIQLIPKGAQGSIAAMRCTELGEAFAALAFMRSLAAYRDVELGGTRLYSYAEYLATLRLGYSATAAWQLTLPNWLTRLGAHVCDALHFSPFSYGHWILLQRDNVPSPNRLPELLARAPGAIDPKNHYLV